jgi:hypothetical protein
MLRHQNFPMASADFTLGAASAWAGSLMVEPVSCGERPANSELDVQFFGDGSSLEVSIEYAADLFSEATIERLAHHHHQVLEMLVFSDEEDTESCSDAALAAKLFNCAVIRRSA